MAYHTPPTEKLNGPQPGGPVAWPVQARQRPTRGAVFAWSTGVARSVAPGMVAGTEFTGGGVIDGEVAQWRRGGGAPMAGSSHFGLRWLGELL
jgi:hypothetical protein